MTYSHSQTVSRGFLGFSNACKQYKQADCTKPLPLTLLLVVLQRSAPTQRARLRGGLVSPDGPSYGLVSNLRLKVRRGAILGLRVTVALRGVFLVLLDVGVVTGVVIVAAAAAEDGADDTQDRMWSATFLMNFLYASGHLSVSLRKHQHHLYKTKALYMLVSKNQ